MPFSIDEETATVKVLESEEREEREREEEGGSSTPPIHHSNRSREKCHQIFIKMIACRCEPH
jgi:hypothetical protein